MASQPDTTNIDQTQPLQIGDRFEVEVRADSFLHSIFTDPEEWAAEVLSTVLEESANHGVTLVLGTPGPQGKGEAFGGSLEVEQGVGFTSARGIFTVTQLTDDATNPFEVSDDPEIVKAGIPIWGAIVLVLAILGTGTYVTSVVGRQLDRITNLDALADKGLKAFREAVAAAAVIALTVLAVRLTR